MIRISLQYAILLILFILLSIGAQSCTETSSDHKESQEVLIYDGHYDNFLQYWKENTEDEIHRDKSASMHRHLHIRLHQDTLNSELAHLELYEGRNNKTQVLVRKIKTQWSEGRLVSDSLELELKGDTVIAHALYDIDTSSPYIFLKCRYFSGWLQYPMPDNPDSIYFQADLKMHDQGGMVELDIEGIDYTAELTQLQFAHTIDLMKLAIYEEPLNQVGINSRSISYTWTSPEAKRLGINLRKIISGWTLIEENYINSNTMKNEKEN